MNYPNNPDASDYEALHVYGMRVNCRWETYLALRRDIPQFSILEDKDRFAFTDSGVIYL